MSYRNLSTIARRDEIAPPPPPGRRTGGWSLLDHPCVDWRLDWIETYSVVEGLTTGAQISVYY